MSHNWNVQEIEEEHGHERLGTLELRWYVVKTSNNSSVVINYCVLVTDNRV